jgi:hypothetical protein
VTRYRVRVRQELVYEIEAADEDAAWAATEDDHFGDPADAVGYEIPDIIYVREDDQ